MAEHPITTYLKQAHSSGMSSEQIARELTNAGWHVHDIVDVVLDHLPPLPKKSETEYIITVEGLTKQFGKMKAIDNLSFKVKRGSVTALLGPNGAGKTTLVRILTTLLTPDEGKVNVAGHDVIRDAQALRSVIGLAGQYAAVDEILSGRENLEMVGRLYNLTRTIARARAEELLAKFDLIEAADRPVKTYSGGMRRRLDLAASLVIKPKVLFLDEPTTGLDPQGRFTLWQIIRDLVAGGTTVLLTTQYLEEADQLAHDVYVINHGRIIASGTPDELKNQTGGDVLELHLADRSQASRAAQVIARLGDAEPHANADTGTVTMSVSGGAQILIDVVRELDAAALKIADIILRRPSMDDVFIKLTGHGATQNEQ